jgi:hypothetical protein
MAVITKKKKKLQLLQQQQPAEAEKQELAGLTQYLTDHRFDKILKRYREDIKAEVAEHNLTKKQIIIRTAQQMEKEGYPVNQICDRISKSSKGLGFGDRYVRRCLDEKYKNEIKEAEASSQKSTVAVQRFRDQEQVKEKDVKEITIDDIKFLTLQKAKQVAKHQIQRADLIEWQSKQKDEKIKELTQQVEDLKKSIARYKKGAEQFQKALDKLDVDKMTDEQIGKIFREGIDEATKHAVGRK